MTPQVQVGLTERERQVLTLLAQSYKLKQIAHQLNQSYHTADSHKTRLMKKLDLHDIAAVTRYAILHGYVEAAYGNGSSTNSTGS